MNIPLALPACLAVSAFAALAQGSKFDGDWKVTMVCPAHSGTRDDAKGYTHHFAGRVVNSELTATHGREGEPGWHLLRGVIGPTGEASLKLEGIVNNPDYAINEAARGKPYSYRVKAQFDVNSGAGQRQSGRVCEFRFSR